MRALYPAHNDYATATANFPPLPDTEGTRRMGLVGSEQAQQLVAETPLGGRFGQPEEIAPVVVFLASDEAAWLTGERISASGGVH